MGLERKLKMLPEPMEKSFWVSWKLIVVSNRVERTHILDNVRKSCE